MNPKKVNSLIKSVAEEFQISETLLEDLVEFTYKNLRSNLTGLTHPRINVDGLGTFVAKAYTVKKGIELAHKKLINHDTSTFNAYFNKKQLETNLQLLTNLNELIIKEEEAKETFKNKKNGKN